MVANLEKDTLPKPDPDIPKKDEIDVGPATPVRVKVDRIQEVLGKNTKDGSKMAPRIISKHGIITSLRGNSPRTYKGPPPKPPESSGSKMTPINEPILSKTKKSPSLRIKKWKQLEKSKVLATSISPAKANKGLTKRITKQTSMKDFLKPVPVSSSISREQQCVSEPEHPGTTNDKDKSAPKCLREEGTLE